MKSTLLAFIFLFHGLFSSIAFSRELGVKDIADLSEDQFYRDLEVELTNSYTKMTEKIFKIKKQDEDKVFKRIEKQFAKLDKQIERRLKKCNKDLKPGLEASQMGLKEWLEEVRVSKERGTLLEDLNNQLTTFKVKELVDEVLLAAKDSDAYELFKIQVKNGKYHKKQILEFTIKGLVLGTIFVINPVAGFIVLGVIAVLYIGFYIILVIVAQSL